MTIFDHIQERRYIDYCFSLTKCYSDAYDLKMDAALRIHSKNYPLNYPYSLFQKVARNLFLDSQKSLPVSLQIDIPEIEQEDDIDTDKVLDLLNQPPRSKRQFVTNEIFKLYLQLKTEQAVADYTGIKRTTIHSQIQKFKNYARENLNID